MRDFSKVFWWSKLIRKKILVLFIFCWHENFSFNYQKKYPTKRKSSWVAVPSRLVSISRLIEALSYRCERRILAFMKSHYKILLEKNCLKISYQPLSIWPRWRFERYALKVLGGGLFSFLIPSRWGVYRTVNIQSWLKSKNKLDLCIRENKLYRLINDKYANDQW